MRRFFREPECDNKDDESASDAWFDSTSGTITYVAAGHDPNWDVDSGEPDLYRDVAEALNVLSAVFDESSDERYVLFAISMVFEMGMASELSPILRPLIDTWFHQWTEHISTATEQMTQALSDEHERSQRLLRDVREISRTINEEDDVTRSQRLMEVLQDYRNEPKVKDD